MHHITPSQGGTETEMFSVSRKERVTRTWLQGSERRSLQLTVLQQTCPCDDWCTHDWDRWWTAKKGNDREAVTLPSAYNISFSSAWLTTAVGWGERCWTLFQIPRFVSTLGRRTDSNLDRMSVHCVSISRAWILEAYGIDRGDVTIAGTRIVLSATVAACPDKDRTFSTASLQHQGADDLRRRCRFYLRIRHRFRMLSSPSDQVHRPPDRCHQDPWRNKRRACPFVARKSESMDLPASGIDIHMIRAMTERSGFHTIGDITV